MTEVNLVRHVTAGVLFAILVAPAELLSQSASHSHAAGDTAFHSMQTRGARAMGVDQYESSHVFETLPDGGRIELQTNAADSAGAAAILAHMREIAGKFAKGEFDIPGFVHAGAVPGTGVMRKRRGAIAYKPSALPRGGQVRITSSDAVAVRAIHEFLAYQRSEHRAPGK